MTLDPKPNQLPSAIRLVLRRYMRQLLMARGHYAALWDHQSGGFLQEDVSPRSVDPSNARA